MIEEKIEVKEPKKNKTFMLKIGHKLLIHFNLAETLKNHHFILVIDFDVISIEEVPYISLV